MNISLRVVNLNDAILLFNWFNNEDSLKFKIQTDAKISYIEHKKWLEKKVKTA